MTVAELYKQVAQLGFEVSLEDDDRFYYAANRALLQVNEVRPAISYYLINHKPLKNLLSDSAFSPSKKMRNCNTPHTPQNHIILRRTETVSFISKSTRLTGGLL